MKENSRFLSYSLFGQRTPFMGHVTNSQVADSSPGGFEQTVKPLIADVPGWLTDEEGEALYDLARACTGKGVIVEIGSWVGKSTICLGRGSLAGASVPIYAVDPHAD